MGLLAPRTLSYLLQIEMSFAVQVLTCLATWAAILPKGQLFGSFSGAASGQAKGDKATTNVEITAAKGGRLLWHLHGAVYDLEDFVAHHPGGEVAIRLAQGEADATALFESYHVFSAAHKRTLDKYRVASSTEPNRVESSFRSDLEAMLTEHFGSSHRSSRRATPARLQLIALLLLATVACLVGWARDSLVAMLCLPVVAWFLAVNCSHDGSHFNLGSPWLNMLAVYTAVPLTYNPMTWYHQHVVSHHIDCNVVGADVDLQHFAPLRLSVHDNLPKQGHHTLLDYLKILAVGLHLCFGVPLFAAGLLDRDFYEKQYGHYIQMPAALKPMLRFRLLNLVGPAAVVAFVAFPFFACSSTPRAALFALIPLAISSLIFLAVTQSSHVQPEVHDPAINAEPDFFKRQARGAVDYQTTSVLWGVLTGGLNAQSLHHVLPHVNSCHYPALYPKFERVCNAHGIVLHKRSSLWGAMKTSMRYVWNLNGSARLLGGSATENINTKGSSN